MKQKKTNKMHVNIWRAKVNGEKDRKKMFVYNYMICNYMQICGVVFAIILLNFRKTFGVIYK